MNPTNNFHPIFSIIVPVYNVQEYLKQCIASIIAQTYRDFEVLLIDDGSTDGSGSICDEVCVLDTRFRAFHTSNKGAAAARNIGLRNAKGRYITFIDSDDEVSINYLATLSQATDDVDLVIEGMKICNSDNSTRRIVSYNDMQLQISSDLINSSFNSEAYFFVHGKRFRSDLIRTHNIFFNESLKIGEDTLFVYSYIIVCRHIRIISATEYIYYKRANSISSESIQAYVEMDKGNDFIEQALHNIINTKSQAWLQRRWIAFSGYILQIINDSNTPPLRKIYLLNQWFSKSRYYFTRANIRNLSNECYIYNLILSLRCSSLLLCWVITLRALARYKNACAKLIYHIKSK